MDRVITAWFIIRDTLVFRLVTVCKELLDREFVLQTLAVRLLGAILRNIGSLVLVLLSLDLFLGLLV